MKKQTKVTITIFVILLALLGIFGTKFLSITGSNTTSYKNVNYNATAVFYSGVITQYNGGNLLPTQIFNQYTGGNIEGFTPFYKNLGFLNFYLNNALNVKSSDFNILAGDGEAVSYGCHLQPNYCLAKPSSSTLISVDSDGCPHYQVTQQLNTCSCYQNYKTCTSDPCAGATYCGWTDCSDYAITQADYGGSTKGATNYKSILQSDGWSYNSGYNCWNKLSPTDSLLNTLSTNMWCRAYGQLDTLENYDIQGTVTWDSTNGLVCNLPETKTGKILSGNTDFYIGTAPQVRYNYYRLQSNQCIVINIPEIDKTSNDYMTLAECTSKISSGGTQNNQSNNNNNSSTQEPPEEIPSSVSNVLYIILAVIAVAIIGIIIYVRRR